MATATEKLKLARRHLDRVQTAALDPVDWAELSMFGLYALEAAVDAACLHFGEVPERSHWKRSDIAEKLSAEHGLDDVSDLLSDLNNIRKSEAYGDVIVTPELDAEDTSSDIEHYIKAVADLMGDR